MIIGQQKPPLNEALLIHYGVKGMRWGVINEDDLTGRPVSGSNPYKTAKPKTPSTQEQRRTVRENERKSLAKLNPSEAGKPVKSHFSAGQNRAMYIAGGAVAVAAILGASYYTHQRLSIPLSNPGHEAYAAQRLAAKTASWRGEGHGFIRQMSHDRPEMTLPAGHTFTRFSKAAEGSFGKATYTSHKVADANRYLGEGYGRLVEYGDDLHKINFSAKQPVRIPNLRTTLDTLGEVMSTGGKKASAEEVIAKYNQLSGSFWDDDTSNKFFSALKTKGYHAIVDEMDAGVQSESPLVIFAHEIMTPKTSTLMTFSDVQKARSLITPLAEAKT